MILSSLLGRHFRRPSLPCSRRAVTIVHSLASRAQHRDRLRCSAIFSPEELASFLIDEMNLGAGWATDYLKGVIRNIVVIMIVQPMLDHERCLGACENSVGHASQQSGDFPGLLTPRLPGYSAFRPVGGGLSLPHGLAGTG
jgi:hypothetical protein